MHYKTTIFGWSSTFWMHKLNDITLCTYLVCVAGPEELEYINIDKVGWYYFYVDTKWCFFVLFCILSFVFSPCCLSSTYNWNTSISIKSVDITSTAGCLNDYLCFVIFCVIQFFVFYILPVLLVQYNWNTSISIK